MQFLYNKKTLSDYYDNFHFMMKDRGYKSVKIPLDFNDENSTIYMKEYHKKISGSYVLSFWCNNIKLDKAFSQSLYSICKNSNVDHLIIILIGENIKIFKKIEEIEKHYKNIGMKIEIFIDSFFVSKMDRYESKFRLASNDEKTSIISSYGLPAKLLQISYMDRISKWLGAEIGDMILEDIPSSSLPYYIDDDGKRIKLYDLIIYNVSGLSLDFQK